MLRIALCALVSYGWMTTAALAQATVPPAAGAAVSGDEMRQIQQSAQLDAARPQPTAVDAAPAAPAAASVGRVLQSVNPDMAVILDVAGAAFAGGSRDGLAGGGHDPTVPGFNLQALEMHLESSVDPYLHFSSALVFGQEGVELEEAYATTLSLPQNLQLQASFLHASVASTRCICTSGTLSISPW